MDPQFWHERWAAQQIGFHEAAVNRNLRDYFAALHAAPGDRIFVPLCGKSLDLWWLAEQGLHVVGVELSPLACEALFAERGVVPQRAQCSGFVRYRYGALTVWCGDYFALTAAQIGNIGLYYDRAALIALPVEMRPLYVAHLRVLLASPACGLLVTLDYPQQEMSGPPFAVGAGEVKTLYAAAEIDLLAQRDVLAEHPRFAERGLSALSEAVFRIGWRADERGAAASAVE